MPSLDARAMGMAAGAARATTLVVESLVSGVPGWAPAPSSSGGTHAFGYAT
jgi:hypothetical protein